MRIASAGKAFPEHYYDQEQLLAAARKEWASQLFNLERLERLYRNVLVGGRHLALPLEEYSQLSGWGEANDAWIRISVDVGERAIREALSAAGLGTDDVDALIFVSVTGVATPSIDARLMNRLGLPERVTRIPIFGLGCVAGAAGIARAADYVKAYPDRIAVLLSVELCSLTLQRQDLSIANLISSGLFGDGGAAVILVGAERGREGPRVVASRSIFYSDTERVMGWEISEKGFQVVLSPEVPQMVLNHLRQDVDAFLSDHGLDRSRIGSWVAHPGGPKVLEAMQEALEIPREALEVTWKGLREVGNLSSASVLLALEATMADGRPEKGTPGLLFAMGPGFCSELVLLEW